jgi:dipeptidyl aminopeptidase/acylaminoacyl peptidase
MKTPFQVDDLCLYQTLMDLDAVPSSPYAACQVQSINPATNAVTTRIGLASLDGSAPRPFTSGESDSMPRWAPDGARLAFLADRGNGQQVYLIEQTGGEARQLGYFASGASSIDWAPDGRKLLVCCTLKVDPEIRGDHGKQQNTDRAPDAPKIIWRLPYKMDGVGYILDSEIHAYVLDATTGEHRALTQGSYQVMSAQFSPDCRHIAYTRTREGRLAHRTDMWLMDADGANQRQVTFDLASVAHPKWSPDGRHIILTGGLQDGDAQLRLWRYDVAEGTTTPLGDDWIEIASGQSVCWSPDSSSVFVVLAHEGRQEIASVSVRDGKVTHLLTGDRHIARMARARDGLVYVSQDATSPNELWYAEMPGQRERRLTDFNAWWHDRVLPVAEVRRFEVPDGRGGTEQIDGWLLRPRDAKGPTPLLVDVHGGPASYVLLDYNMHSYWYVLLSRGWSVLALNPVGSSSYGREFSSRLRQHWGKYDLDQHLAAIDILRRQEVVGSRVAIAGKSYGGFLSAWAVCNSTAFCAAVVSAPVTSLENHFGTSDSGYYADTYSMYGEPAAKRDLMRELSPMDYVENVRTPTLILQGEADERCPKCQAEELYTGIMYSTETEAEMVLYPGASHHFLESGNPAHRVDAATRLVGWLERYCT